MNINILRYSLFGIAEGQEVDRNFSSIFYVIIYVVHRLSCPKDTKNIGVYCNSST